MNGASVSFRFNADSHTYVELATGEILPHVTGMLKWAGLVDDSWFTEDSRVRGTAVHKLTADYDLGAIEDLDSVLSGYKPYLLAHVAVVQILRPEFLEVEEPIVHPVHRYGCRPDRVVRVDGILGVWEEKSGAPTKAHPIQTALQAIAVGQKYHLPPEALARTCVYVDERGRFKVRDHTVRADFAEARRIIREYPRREA